jgi:hypothetical protein
VEAAAALEAEGAQAAVEAAVVAAVGSAGRAEAIPWRHSVPPLLLPVLGCFAFRQASVLPSSLALRQRKLLIVSEPSGGSTRVSCFSVEGIPVPTEDGRWRLIPILGEAK